MACSGARTTPRRARSVNLSNILVAPHLATGAKATMAPSLPRTSPQTGEGLAATGHRTTRPTALQTNLPSYTGVHPHPTYGEVTLFPGTPRANAARLGARRRSAHMVCRQPLGELCGQATACRSALSACRSARVGQAAALLGTRIITAASAGTRPPQTPQGRAQSTHLAGAREP